MSKNFMTSSLLQRVGLSMLRLVFLRLSTMWNRLIANPLNWDSRSESRSSLPDSAVLAILGQSFFSIWFIHMVISVSRNLMSSKGSCCPGLQSLPSESVAPAMSTTWRRASAFLISSKNWFPSPRPFQAPGTSPATSISSTGTNLIPSRHREFFGLSSTLNSVWTQGVRRYPMPRLGLMVVKG